MGANLKGKGGIKGLMLRHGEKIVIVVVGLLAGWFVYKSLWLPRLEAKYKAEELQKQISRTTAEVNDFNWDTATKDHVDKVRIFQPLAKGSSRKVDVKKYPFTVPFDPVVIAATALRADPQLLNPVDVRATGGSGLLAFMDAETRRKMDLKLKTEAAELERKQQEELKQQQQQQEQQNQRPGRGGRNRQDQLANTGQFDQKFPNRRMVEGLMTNSAGLSLQGGERIERAYWATVVAKVPIREQLKLYQDAFENARGYDATRDFPQYVGYLVQRAEVVAGKPLEWKAVPLYDGQQKSLSSPPIDKLAVTINSVAKLKAAMSNWVPGGMEPVDPRFLDSVLTLPLPPLVGREWGAEATHPDIPLATLTPRMVEDTTAIDDQPEGPMAESEDQLTIQGANTQGLGAATPSGFGTGFGQMSEFSPSYESRGGPGGFAREGFGSASPGGGFQMGGQRTTLQPGADFVLLRFFDYSVQPGKKYKYRVKLLLADPNQGMLPTMLDSSVQDRLAKEAQAAKAAKREKRFFRFVDDWSEPSPTVGIPVAGDVRIASARMPSEKYNDEPTVTLWAETFALDPEQDIPVHVAKEKVLRRGGVANLNEKMFYSGENDRWRDEYESFNLETGYTLLDVDGAKRLGKDMTAPARVVLMDASGEMTIRNETNDTAAVQKLKIVFTEDKRRRGNDAQMGPEFFGGRGPGRGP